MKFVMRVEEILKRCLIKCKMIFIFNDLIGKEFFDELLYNLW